MQVCVPYLNLNLKILSWLVYALPLLNVLECLPTTRDGSPRDLNIPWGGFTPFQRGAVTVNNKPWWGPSRTSLAEEYPELRSELFEGDILLPFEDSRNGVKAKKFLWSRGIIPYRFAPGNFTANMTSMVLNSMRVIESETCVKFVEHKSETEFIELRSIPQRGCHAMIGRRPGKKEPLPVNLQNPECFYSIGIVEHELLHVVGLLHEQSRVDRDQHVTVHWENIEQIYWSEFSKVGGKEVSTFDLPYDYKSIMHYPTWAFSKNGKSTITAKGYPNMELGQRNGPSRIDFQKVRRMYNCNGNKYY